MLERALLDPIPFWPFVLWPILGSTVLFSFFTLNRSLHAEGKLVSDMYSPLFLPVISVISIGGSIYETLLVFFCFYTMGWLFLLWFPAVAFLSIPVCMVFGLLPFGQYLVPILYVFLVLCFLVLIGLVNIEFVAQFNDSIRRMLGPEEVRAISPHLIAASISSRPIGEQ